VYGVGDTVFSLTSNILGANFAIFMTDVVGITPGVAAAAIFIEEKVLWLCGRGITFWRRDNWDRPFTARREHLSLPLAA
jgi:hypothetical protein